MVPGSTSRRAPVSTRRQAWPSWVSFTASQHTLASGTRFPYSKNGRHSMDGLFLRGEDGYEDARVGRVFNRRRPDRYPDAVLIAADADAVAEGVRLARSRGWPVAVRSGGHSWAVWSVRDGGLL